MDATQPRIAVDPNPKSGPTAATGTAVGNFDGIEATDRPLRVVPWLRRDAGDGASSRTNSPRPTLSSSIAVAVGTAMAMVMVAVRCLLARRGSLAVRLGRVMGRAQPNWGLLRRSRPCNGRAVAGRAAAPSPGGGWSLDGSIYVYRVLRAF